MNLIEETNEVLEAHNKTPADVKWVGSKCGQFAMPFSMFVERFADLEYNEGFGRHEINSDLVVVGHDWWLERGEYDGSEWWDFHTLPTQQSGSTGFDAVSRDRGCPAFVDGW